jgi:protein KRI1
MIFIHILYILIFVFIFKQLPEQLERSFYKTLACLKNKDPRIYDKGVQFFLEHDNNLSNVTQSKDKKQKSLFLRDYERKMIVERGGKFSDSEDEIEEINNKPHDSTYIQEQLKIKESFKKVIQNDEDKLIEDILLKPKIKTKEEVQKVIFLKLFIHICFIKVIYYVFLYK